MKPASLHVEPKNPSRTPAFSFLCLTGLFILLSLFRKTNDYDFWFHLHAGRLLLEHQVFLKSNFLSFTQTDHVWINHAWLFQVILYAVFKVFSFYGVYVFKAVLLLGATYFIFRTSKILLGGRTGTALAVSFLCVWVLSTRFFERPELISYCLISLEFYLLEQFRRGKSSYGIFLPLIQLVWVNSHGYFILGILILILWGIGDGMNSFLQKKEEQDFPKGYFSSLGKILFLCTGVLLLNPRGLAGVWFPVKTALNMPDGSQAFMSTIHELIGPFQYPYLPPYYLTGYVLLIIVFIVTTAMNIKNIRLRYLMPAALALAASMAARRNIPIFALTASLVVAGNLGDIRDYFETKYSAVSLRKIRNMLVPVVLCFMLSANMYVFASGWYSMPRTFGMGPAEFIFPERAVAFIQAEKLKGPFFNTFQAGHYLAWILYPEDRVYIDGRTAAYDAEFFLQDYQAVTNGDSKAFERVIKRYDIQYFMLDYASRNVEGLIRRLAADDRYRLVYADEVAVIFLLNTSKYQSIFNRSTPVLKRFFSEEPAASDVSKAGTAWMRHLEISQIPVGLKNQGYLFYLLGAYDRALEFYDEALTVNDHLFSLHNDRGAIYGAKGDFKRSAEAFKKAIQIEDRHPTLYYNLARALSMSGNSSEALEVLNLPDFR